MKRETFTIEGDAMAAVDRFVDRHARHNIKSSIGRQFWFSFHPAGIGVAAFVHCFVCKRKRNVTDYGAW